jgi:hypothetical protein
MLATLFWDFSQPGLPEGWNVVTATSDAFDVFPFPWQVADGKLTGQSGGNDHEQSWVETPPFQFADIDNARISFDVTYTPLFNDDFVVDDHVVVRLVDEVFGTTLPPVFELLGKNEPVDTSISEQPQGIDTDLKYRLRIRARDYDSQPSIGNITFDNITISSVLDQPPTTAEIVAVSPNPRAGAVSEITITFSQEVTGFDLGDLAFTRTADGTTSVPLGSAMLSTTDRITWTLANLDGVTGASGIYELALIASGTGIRDSAGNDLSQPQSIKWINGAGDADLNNSFDQFDLIIALQGGKYLTGEAVTWRLGDWNGDGVFNQFDIITVQQTKPTHYQQGTFSVVRW